MKENVVFQGDNLPLMKELEGGKIDLIYIDPPFCSQAVYKSKAFDEKIECEFNDEFRGGVQSYIHWLKPRLQEIHRLLSDKGVFCLHIDQRTSHYAKIELDKIFGYNNFINQVIWDYSGNSTTSRFYPRKHDIILIYSKNQEHTFNTTYRPYSEATLKRYNHEDKQGRFKISTLNGKTEKVYMKEGCPVQDVWSDCPVVRKKEERCGYPTQKPLKLLDRLIETFTKKGDMVADFFCGCGTATSSAQNLGRRWLGCDVSKDAISVIKKRMMRDHNLKVKVIKTNSLSASNIMKLSPLEFEKHVVSLLGIPNKKQVGDGGVDGYTHDHIPIQVKKSYKVGRPVIDSFHKHIEKRGAGIIIAHSFSSCLIEEKNKLENERGWTIALIETRDLIRDAS